MAAITPQGIRPVHADPARGEDRSIKWVVCVIRPEKLDLTVESLNGLGLVGGMTVTDVRGFGRQKGQVELYRGEAISPRFLPKVMLELAVPAAALEETMQVIRSASSTGRIGDGKIFVLNVVDAMRVRTRERGISAL